MCWRRTTRALVERQFVVDVVLLQLALDVVRRGRDVAHVGLVAEAEERRGGRVEADRVEPVGRHVDDLRRSERNLEVLDAPVGAISLGRRPRVALGVELKGVVVLVEREVPRVLGRGELERGGAARDAHVRLVVDVVAQRRGAARAAHQHVVRRGEHERGAEQVVGLAHVLVEARVLEERGVVLAKVAVRVA